MHAREDTVRSILITGAGGLLGARMVDAVKGGYTAWLQFHNPPEKMVDGPVYCGDLGDEYHVKELAAEIAPDVIINCAALAEVDRCETDPDSSYRANVVTVKNLIAGFPRAKLVQISTDYVFGDDPDRGSAPPAPDHQPNPINIYGKHKLEAEEATLSASPDNLVVRVNTLFDYIRKRNFFRFVYDSLKDGRNIVGASDQVSNPISAFGAAGLVMRLLEKRAAGIFHLGGREFVSRFELACRIARDFDLDESLVAPVTTDALHRPAARPKWAGLDCRLTEKYMDVSMPVLDEELSRIKEEMGRDPT